MTRLPLDTLRRPTALKAALFIAAAWFAAGNPAQADTTFLLQLGTFESETLATQKWEEVKSKNADVLGNLSLHVAEVALPPDNAKSYRAQVGPVASREQAASLCKSLQERDVSCYVVETAMFGAEAASAQGESPSVPAVPDRRHAVAQEDASHADDPDYIPPPVDSGPVIISTQPATVSPAELAEMPTPAPAPAAVAAPAPMVSRETPAPAEVTQTSPHGNYVPGRGPRFLNEETAPTRAVAEAAPPAPPAPKPLPPAAPAKPAESPGFFSRLFGAKPAPTEAEGVVGSVNVSEAVRVPLSSANQPPRQKIVPVLPEAHPAALPPDASTTRTFWAQVSYFRDETQALTFYREFSAASPQYTNGVRIRITRPFATGSTSGKVSLRVGPFAGTEDVRTLCAAASRWNARCTVVRDLGASSPAQSAPTRASAQNAPEGYWVQLGSYRSEQEAWDAWKAIKRHHRKLVRRVNPMVTTPPQSSAEAPVFRLRAGPLTSESSANTLCTRMQSAGIGCVAIADH